MKGRRVLATAGRLLVEIRHDPRTLVMVMVVPSVLMTLLRYAFSGQRAVFQHSGPAVLALFPFTAMFVVASISMLRERTGGTLERLFTSPLRNSELLGGYSLAFGSLAVVQAGLTASIALGPLGLDVAGPLWAILGMALLSSLLGSSLGLFLSAFARTEFQAVQFLPAFVLPQLLLCGLFVPRDSMAAVLHWISWALPLTYALDGVSRVSQGANLSGYFVRDLVVLASSVPAAVVAGALTLRRRTP